MQSIKLEPILTYYILQVLIDYKTFERTEPEFSQAQYLKLCREQKSIGWQQVLYGRLTHTWVDIQNDYVKEGEIKGIQIIALCIKSIYDIIIKRWKIRCTNHHSKCPIQEERIKILY